MAFNLYIGAGSDRIQGFFHLDNNVTKQFKGGNKRTSPEIIADLRDPLPLRSATVDVIYTIHTLEHLTHPELMSCLRECYRSLKYGATMRIVVPCFDCMIKDYLKKDFVADHVWEIDPNLPLEDYTDLFIARVFYHDHKYLHNFTTLQKALIKAGFSNIINCGPGETSNSDLQSVFFEKEISRYGDVIVEATKGLPGSNQSQLMVPATRNVKTRLELFFNLRLARSRGLLPCFPERLWFYEKLLKLKLRKMPLHRKTLH
jgi:predicted SAM-dependent methyltransferase